MLTSLRPIILALLCLTALTVSAHAESLSIEFKPPNPEDKVTGNLIVVISNRNFQASRPGLLSTYLGDVFVKEKVTLKSGDTVTIDLGEATAPVPLYVGAYLDENQNFMWRGLPDQGEFYTSELSLIGRQGTTKLVLDTFHLDPQRQVPPWMQERKVVSQQMLDAGFDLETSTTKLLVGLPPGYWEGDEEYPVVFVSHGFNGDRWSYFRRYRQWRDQMKDEPMILVSMDSFGSFGHHLFLNSEANGPRLDSLTKDIVPYIDQTYRTNGKRVIYGQSSGGWTAVSVLRRAPELFVGAVATGPDPLKLRQWWMGDGDNIYQNPDGTQRFFAPILKLDMESFVDIELRTQSFGQFAGFLAAFSPYRPTNPGMPFLSPFDLETGKVRPEVWKLWQENDQALWAIRHPKKAREAFAYRLVLIAGEKDEFGLRDTTLQFSHTLNVLEIPHLYYEIPGAGHTNYLERPAFVSQLWSVLYKFVEK